MANHEAVIRELLVIARGINPAYPFACCIQDAAGQVLVTAVNATHISPLYSAEGLALHLLNQYFRPEIGQSLALYTTAEPELIGISAMLYARRLGINIEKVVFGTSHADLRELWGCQVLANSRDLLSALPETEGERVQLIGPVLHKECRGYFSEAHELIQTRKTPVLSVELGDFWMEGDWVRPLDE